MISVVIPAYNEEKTIGNCLDALVNQKTNRKFEVIVVDNNSTDATAEKAKEYREKLDLKIVLQKEKGRGAARKMGFAHAKGEIVLSTDADTVVPSLWIDTLVNTLENANAIAVTGVCHITDCGWMTNAIFNFSQPFCMRIYRILFGHYWLNGFNFGIYKTAYEKSGGFNAKLNVQEDIALSFKVNAIGKIQFLPHVSVVFSGRRFQKGLVKGSLPYFTTFIKYFFYKKDSVILSDIR